MDESKSMEEIRNWEHPPWYGIDQFKESHIDFLGESEGSLPPLHDSFPDACEAINDFWSMSGSFIYRHHVEPRVKLYSPREESFPIPLKYIDVSRTTRTNLDVKQEKRIDDYWNIDGSRDLSDPWTGFTQLTLLEEKAPEGYMWSGRRLTRKQLTSRPDHLSPELWKSMESTPSSRRSKSGLTKSSILKTLENCEGSISSTLRIRNSKKPSRTRVRSWKHQWLLLCPAKFWKIVGVVHPTKLKTKLACILEADESTRMRMGNSIPHHHEDHIAGKGENSLQHYNLVHKFIPMPQAVKVLAAKAAVDKEWEKWRKLGRGTWRKLEVRKRWSMKQGRLTLQFILHH